MYKKMKKTIGVIGVCVFALTMFFNVNPDNNNNNNGDLELSTLLAMNTANAEQIVVITDCDASDPEDTCSYNNNYPGCDNSWFWDDCKRAV
jgi:hypothetical protein